MTDWFTADWHLGHRNIISFCDRPFASVEEMNWTIIRNVKECLKPGDRLWILGDLSFVPPRQTAEYLQWLQDFDLRLILGNHDRPNGPSEHTARYFTWWGHYRRIDIDGQKIVLSHYPFESWHGSYRGAWHLHGHCHGSLKRVMRNRVDVGVDCFDFRPVSFEELKNHPNMQREPHDEDQK